MKRLYHFVPLIILSLFISIFLILFQLCVFINNTVLDPQIYNQAMNEKNVTQSIYDDLCTYFKSLSNATGIPTEVFTAPLDKEALYTASFKLLSESLNYITDKNAPKPSPNYDFTSEEESITNYIEKHASENNIEKNDEYKKLLKNTVDTAKTQIQSRFDVVMLYTLAKSSAGEKLHNYSYLFSIGSYVTIGLVIVLLVIMIIIDRHHPRDYPYWVGLIMVVSSGFWLIPAVYLKATEYFQTFFVRNEYIHKAVTGMFEISLDRIIRTQLILFIVGVVLIVSTLIIHYVYLHHLRVQYHKSHDHN